MHYSSYAFAMNGKAFTYKKNPKFDNVNKNDLTLYDIIKVKLFYSCYS